MGVQPVDINDLMAQSGVIFGTSGARGLASDMTDKVCYAYTTAFIQFLEETAETAGNKYIAIGGDFRSSTDRIMSAVAKAVEDRGYSPVNCGKLPTPALSYYGLVNSIPTIMITGSHIPEDRNGIKYAKKEGEILKHDEAGIKRQTVALPQGLFDENGFFTKQMELIAPTQEATELYINRYLDFFPKDCLLGKRIGIYQHSAVGRELMVKIFYGLGAKVEKLGFSDTFIPVDTEAIRSEDVELARKWAVEFGFDAIVSTDGDSDRPLISDENGKWLRGDVAGILCASYLKADAVTTPVSSNSAVERSNLFKTVYRTKVGSPYVIEGIQKALNGGAKRAIGYEANGGFLLASDLESGGKILRALPTRDAIILHIAILLLSIEKNMKISELLAELPQRFTFSNRLKNFPTEESTKQIRELSSRDELQNKQVIEVAFDNQFGEAALLDRTDGLRITFKSDEVVHLRPSGNAPELRCYNEADTESRAVEMNKICMNTLESWRTGLHPLAGKKAPNSILVNVPKVVSAYYLQKPDIENTAEKVSFGTSGHRGMSTQNSFNEDHILAIVQAICDFRRKEKIDGPLFLGKDTHALSEPAHSTAIEVLTANGIEVVIQKDNRFTPTPVISHAIVACNRNRKSKLADGIVVTPSHNPPDFGGIKYNSVSGGPANPETTNWIAERANYLIKNGNKDVMRKSYTRAINDSKVTRMDYIESYVEDLENIIDISAIRSAGLKIGADALGGSGLHYWDAISAKYGIKIDVINCIYDPTFSFMTIDKDGEIRMDCSSSYAMKGLIGLKEGYDVAFGNDPDFDRHGIITPGAGLLESNRYLSVAIWYLFQHRKSWSPNLAVGKTVVSSSMIDKIARHLGIGLFEVPVGIKWFVDDLMNGKLAFGGEESAGAIFIRKDGQVWATDKDGIIMSLLAAEITGALKTDPGEVYKGLESKFGSHFYARIDVKTTLEKKEILKQLSSENICASKLAGEKIIDVQTVAPGNKAKIGGLKATAENGWFAARPSGTENIYKIYAESVLSKEHLLQIQIEAEEIVNRALQ
jgi:alpha-D-glucose phosphate-specific phosphoglucomutase